MKTVLESAIINKFSWIIIVLVATLSHGKLHAQNVGINNPAPNAKALLDLTSSDKGLLTPRMTQAERTAMFPSSDLSAKGMLVYQTDGKEGFYYYDGNNWIFQQNEASGWSTTGNAGTNPSTNYIGTTDNQGLSIATYGKEKIRILPNGNTGIGISNPSVKLEVRDSSWLIPMRVRNMLNNGYSVTQYFSANGNAAGHVGQVNPGASNHTGNFIVGSISNTPVAITSNDVERMRITPTGTVGIGTATPQSHVEIQSNSATGYGQLQLTETEQDYSRVVFKNTANTKWWELAAMPNSVDSLMSLNFYHSNNGDLMTLKGNGRVGIGAWNPKSKLHVANGTSGIQPNVNALLTVESNVPAYLNMLSAAESGILFGSGTDAQSGGIVYNPASVPNSMFFRTGGNVNRMCINDQGHVTIGNGVTWAQYRLGIYAAEANNSLVAMRNTDVTGLSGTHYYSAGGTLVGIAGYANSSYSSGTGTFVQGTLSNNAFTFYTNSTERMRITENGLVGIGTAAPQRQLDVVDSNVGIVARFQGTNNAGYSIAHWIRSDGVGAHVGFFNPGVALPLAGTFVVGTFGNAPVAITTNDVERIHVEETGDVGINTSNPTAELEINGYTKLGSDAPAIKMKKLTGTTSSTQGAPTNVPHGLGSAGKILAVNILLDYSGGNCVPPGYTINPNYEYYYFVTNSTISVYPVNGNSSSIVNKPFRILITYEE